MDDSAILVFTSRDQDQLGREGGSQAWALDAARARRCAYLVCSWNQFGDHNGNQRAAHREGFLVAKIDAIQPSPEEPTRSIIRFSEWAPLAIPELWGGWRNPVKYTSLSELGIAVDDLEFRQVATRASRAVELPNSGPNSQSGAGLNIADAKHALAVFYQVPASSVEITIRG